MMRYQLYYTRKQACILIFRLKTSLITHCEAQSTSQDDIKKERTISTTTNKQCDEGSNASPLVEIIALITFLSIK